MGPDERAQLSARRPGRLDLRRHRRLPRPDRDRAECPSFLSDLRKPPAQRGVGAEWDGIDSDGELSDEDEEKLGKAIAEMVDDFGPDFDEEGNELEEGESDRAQVRGGALEARSHRGRRTEGEEAAEDEVDRAEKTDRVEPMRTRRRKRMATTTRTPDDDDDSDADAETEEKAGTSA